MAIRVVTFTPVEHEFCMALVDRAVRQGLLVPDELQAASGVWNRLTRAQEVEPSPASTTPPPSGEETPHE